MDQDGAEGAALQQAAWEVYGVAPADFVTTRTRWVKELRSRKQREAAKSVAALRKPSVSAAAVNALVRAEDPVADRLRDVGTRMRHAQSALDAQGLAALRGERDEVLRDWVEAARKHATGPMTATVESEVRDTAVAALADGAAAEVVLSGTLTRALSYSGFGEVDVSDAVARTSTGVVLTRIEGGGATETLEPEDGDEEADEEDGDEEAEEEAEPEDVDGEDDEPEDDEPEDDEPEDVGEAAEEDEPGLTADAALADLEEALAEAEKGVTSARRTRRAALDAAGIAATRAEEAEEALARARDLLAHAEEETERAVTAEEQARAALTNADATLAEARDLRDQARAALEEAEDAG